MVWWCARACVRVGALWLSTSKLDVIYAMNVHPSWCAMRKTEKSTVGKIGFDASNTQRNRNIKCTRTTVSRDPMVRCVILCCSRIVKLKTNDEKSSRTNNTSRCRDIHPIELLERRRPLGSSAVRLAHCCCCCSLAARSLDSITVVNQLLDNISLFLTTITQTTFWVSASAPMSCRTIFRFATTLSLYVKWVEYEDI